MENKLLIFDLDGTIADTINTIRDAVNMCMSHFGYPTLSYEQTRDNVGFGARELIRLSLPKEMSENGEILDEAVKYYDGSCYPVTYKNGTDCYEGILDSLATLKDRGYTVAVLSNKRDIFVVPMVKEMIPEGIVSIAMGQRDELPKKPDPAMALYIAKKLGFEACNTAFIGDSETDILTGQNAKMLTVGCSWGYRGRAVLEEAGADVIIDAPKQLCELFCE